MPARLLKRFSGSVRYKLLGLALLPIVLVLPGLLIFTAWWTHQFSYEQLYRKVNTDLAVAREGFRLLQRDHIDSLKLLAESYAFRTNVEANRGDHIANQLQALRSTSDFDFLHLIDARGKWLYESSVTGAGSSRASPQWTTALQTAAPSAGLEVFTAEDLRRESPELAERARIPLQHTPHALATARAAESRGLVLRTVYPITDRRGQVVALLDGGILLNRNVNFVDTIRDLVYGPGSIPAGGWGAVTVFLGDVRISTNVPLRRDGGGRALGTRVSKDVRIRVLDRGRQWIDRAFVVDDWYISAYAPLRDVAGQPIGMLYAGFVEAPFRSAYYRALAVLFGALAVSLAFAAWLAFRGAKSIFQPIEAMAAVVRAEQAGENRRVGPVSSRDELGELARQFDTMLDLLDRRRRQIARAADGLEAKVDARTRELRARNEDLQRTVDLLRETRRRLVMSEKLAALGELTSGIAHEINNPIAVMLGNIDVVLAELGSEAEPVRHELDLIIEQVYRVRAIVDKLLQYSRPSDYVGYTEAVDVNSLIEDTLLLVRHELQRKRIRVECRFDAETPVGINRQELQQVLVNLLVNALHALPEGGRIELSTDAWGNRGVVIRLKDYGKGIPPELLDRIFDPFFTTRGEAGTGLGLSVSYGLMRRYGGEIAVESVEGAWTRFDVFVLREPEFAQTEEGVAPRAESEDSADYYGQG